MQFEWLHHQKDTIRILLRQNHWRIYHMMKSFSDVCKKIVKNVEIFVKSSRMLSLGVPGGFEQKILKNYFSTGQDISFIVWHILGHFKLKLTKMAKKSIKWPLGVSWGFNQKNFFYKTFQIINTKLFWYKSFSLKSIFKKNEKKVDALGPFSTVQTSEAYIRRVRPFRYNHRHRIILISFRGSLRC